MRTVIYSMSVSLDGFIAGADGGAGLASTLIKLDLIDEYRLFVNPLVLGAARPTSRRWIPRSSSSCSRPGRSAPG